MAQTTVNFEIDENVKLRMESACKDMGMSLNTAFNIFAIKVGNERKIPFEVSADPFYSESNMKYLEKVTADIDEGKANLVEHDLIEVDWWNYSGKKQHGKTIVTGKHRTKNIKTDKYVNKRYPKKYF